MVATSKQEGTFSAAGIGAGLLVLFVLSGRWNLARVTSTDLGLFGEPRVYIVMLLALVVLSPGLRDRGAVRERIALERTAVGACAFFGYMSLTGLWAPEGSELIKAAELGLVLVAVIATLRLCRAVGPHNVAELFWRWLVPALGAFAVLGVVAGSSADGRLAVLGGGPNVFGRNMGLLAVAMLGLVLQRRRGSLALGTAVVAAALVLLSGSRGALVATAGGIATLVYLNGRQVGRVVYIAIGVAIVAAGVLEFTEFGAEAVEMFQHRVLRLALEDRYDSGRTDVYTRAWELGVEAPWLGIGLNGFRVIGNHVYPHNIFLETFCEGGLVGIVLLLLFIGPAMLAVAKRRPGPAPREYGAFIVVLLSAQFSGDLYDSRTVFVFATLLLVLTAAGPLRRKAPRAGGSRNERGAT